MWPVTHVPRPPFTCVAPRLLSCGSTVGAMRSRRCAFYTAVIAFAASTMLAAPAVSIAREPIAPALTTSATTKTFGSGYRLTGADGSVYAFGATNPGSLRGVTLHRPIVGMASTPRFGYWLVASDGGIFSFGDATFHGSTGNLQLNKPIVDMAATPTGRGYWLVASDGGIFSFGDATFHGSTGGQSIPAPVVGIALQPRLNPYQPRSTGYDISWPQCGGPYPASPHAITIVGINRGLTFSTNPCLASEAAWAGASLTVYVNVDGLPNDSVSGVSGPVRACGVSDLLCRAYNWGAAAAEYDIAAAKSAGVHASMWWLDVEIGKPWRTDDQRLNVEVIKAMRDRFQRRGFIVGIYSNVYQWGVITGGAFAPGLPLWVPGAKSAAEAVQYCNPIRAFGGGVIWLTQWTTQYDNNYACN